MVPFQKVIVVYDPEDPTGNTRQFIPASWPETIAEPVIHGIMELEYLNVKTPGQAAAWINGTHMLQPPRYGPETSRRLEQEGFFGTHWHWNGEAVFNQWAHLAVALLVEADAAAVANLAKL